MGVTMLEEGSDWLQAKAIMEDALQRAGFMVDYVELADSESLELLTHLGSRPARLLVAGYLGATRLIDNMHVQGRVQ